MCFKGVEVAVIRPCQGLIVLIVKSGSCAAPEPTLSAPPPRAARGCGRRCWERGAVGEGRRGKGEISIEERSVRLCLHFATLEHSFRQSVDNSG